MRRRVVRPTVDPLEQRVALSAGGDQVDFHCTIDYVGDFQLVYRFSVDTPNGQTVGPVAPLPQCPPGLFVTPIPI